MSEVNARWKAGHNQTRRVLQYLAAIALVCWPVSYYSGWEVVWIGHSIWSQAFAVVAFLGAVASTLGALIAGGAYVADKEPPEGSNGS